MVGISYYRKDLIKIFIYKFSCFLCFRICSSNKIFEGVVGIIFFFFLNHFKNILCWLLNIK